MSRPRARFALTALAALVSLGTVATFSSPAAARTSFDPAQGTLLIPHDENLLLAVDFETPESLVGLARGRWIQGADDITFNVTPITDPASAASLLTNGGDDAVSGAHAARFDRNGGGLVLADPALFAKVAGARFGCRSGCARRVERSSSSTTAAWHPALRVGARRANGPRDQRRLGRVRRRTARRHGVGRLTRRRHRRASAFSRSSGEFLLDALEVAGWTARSARRALHHPERRRGVRWRRRSSSDAA